MKKLLCIAAALCAVCWSQQVSAQYYTWGSDPAGLKWSTIRTPEVRMIYPDMAADLARRTLFYIRTVQPDISYGYQLGPMRIPFVMHTENFQSNGLVMYLPKRVEFLTSPSIDGYSMPWGKQLVAHEYRHAVQYNNLNRGFVRALSYVLGQQGSTIGLLCLPFWAIEGDATLCETQMSTFGRGLQPAFTMEYRALGNDIFKRKNIDKWFCGSYREFVPDHYKLGYQISAYAYDRYQENIWDKVSRYSARNLYVIFTTTFGLKKYYKTRVDELFCNTFEGLNRHWDSIPHRENSAMRLTALEDKNYTTYQWPLSLGDSVVLAVKKDLDQPSRMVVLDGNGVEKRLFYTGQLSTRPALGDGRVWWTEYRRSKLFEQRVNSQLCYADLSDGRPRTWSGHRNVLYPTPVDNGGLAWVEYDPNGRYTVVELRGKAEIRTSIPEYKEIHGLAWDDLTRAIYVIITDDDGMWLGRVDVEGLHRLTQGAYITLSDLRAGGGKLYFGSIASGFDEAHCYDLLNHREYRISTSTYGSFDPVPAGGNVLMTTYERRGYYLSRQRRDTLLTLVAPTRLPKNIVNPSHIKWNVVNLDTVRFTPNDSLESSENFRTKRYRKTPNMVNIHSWMPLAFNPFQAIDEHVIDLNLGVTLLSQNLLSNTEAFASYGWNRGEGSLLKLGMRYFGLGVHFDLDASYGGNQVFYTFNQFNTQTGKPEYQKIPAPNKYYSVGLSSTLPLYFQRGYHARQLSISAGWNYSNGMVADLGKLVWDGDKITNIEYVGFKEGLHKLSFGLGFSDMVRLAPRDFASPWGYQVSVNYTFNPANSHFSDLVSAYGKVHTPGFFSHHSFIVAANYQTSIGGYRLPSGAMPLGYKSTRLLPNGIKSSEILSDQYTALAADYQLPVWYPEGGIGSLLYIKRIRLNLAGCFAQFRAPEMVAPGKKWQYLWSYGGDIIFDFNILRLPDSATSTFKFSLYHPSTGGVWIGAGLGLPF